MKREAVMEKQRRRQERKTQIPLNGLSSLLVIFAVLCLTIFAILTISTVQADRRLVSGMMETAAAYQEADCLGEEVLALLRQGADLESVFVHTGCTVEIYGEEKERYRWSCPVSETQKLEAEVRIGEGGQSYEIIRWQLVSAADWQVDDSLAVWDGEG